MYRKCKCSTLKQKNSQSFREFLLSQKNLTRKCKQAKPSKASVLESKHSKTLKSGPVEDKKAQKSEHGEFWRGGRESRRQCWTRTSCPHTRLYSWRVSCKMMSLTAAKTKWMFLVSVAQVKWEQMIRSLSGFKSTNIFRMNSRPARGSRWGPDRGADRYYSIIWDH